jgi:AraC-like DNA-binding protein
MTSEKLKKFSRRTPHNLASPEPACLGKHALELDKTNAGPPMVASTQGADRVQVLAGRFHYRITDYQPGQRLGAHCHESAKISTALAGVYREAFGRETFECDRGLVLLKPAGAGHVDSYGKLTVTVLTIDVDAAMIDSLVPARRLFDGPGLMRLRSPILSSMIGELHRRDPVTLFALEGLGLELLAVLIRGGRAPFQAPAAFRRACEYIDAHLGETLRIANVAAAVGVHAAHLTRLFRTHADCSPARWARNRRIEVAQERLLNTSVPIAELAGDLGFYDQSHLTNVFRSATGITPAAYRNR